MGKAVGWSGSLVAGLASGLTMWAAANLLAHGTADVLDSQSAVRGADDSDAVVCENLTLQRFRVGVRIVPGGGGMTRVFASCTVPMEWPEQSVRLLTTEKPRNAHLETRRVGGTAEQMLLRLPSMPAGSDVVFARTYEIGRWHQRLHPEAARRLKLPTTERARSYLLPSDGIECTHPEIRQLAEETVEGQSEPLVRAVALFQVTRERIRYVEGPFAGALAGLRAGQGDCEERSTLFIALCRAVGIPARLVWGPGHAWSEIALADSKGEIVWVPADPTKEKELGVIRHNYPILQKGDRFRLPEASDRPVRYLSPRCTGFGAAPELVAIEEVLPEDALPQTKR